MVESKRIKFLVHAGLPKCGTTTLQAILEGHRGDLDGLGIGLISSPDLSYHDENDGSTLGASPLFEDLFAGRIQPISLATRLNDSLGAIARKGKTTAVLSAENLGVTDEVSCQAIEQLFKAIRSDIDIVPIIYVRRQDELIESSWKQWDSKISENFIEYIVSETESCRYNFKVIADFWKGKIAQEKPMHINMLSRDLLWGGDLWSDFCRACEFPDPLLDWNRNVPRINPSPPRPWLNFINESRGVMFNDIHDTRVYDILELLLSTGNYESYHSERLIDATTRSYILEKYALSNGQFVDGYVLGEKKIKAESYFGLDKKKTKISAKQLYISRKPGELTRGFREITTLSMFYLVEQLRSMVPNIAEMRKEITEDIRQLRKHQEELGRFFADLNPALLRYVGRIDEYDGTQLWGWVIAENLTCFTPQVSLSLGGTIVDTVVANRFRQDLVGNGSESGCAGFLFSIPEGTLDNCVVQVLVKGADVALPGSGKELGEFRISKTPNMTSAAADASVKGVA